MPIGNLRPARGNPGREIGFASFDPATSTKFTLAWRLAMGPFRPEWQKETGLLNIPSHAVPGDGIDGERTILAAAPGPRFP